MVQQFGAHIGVVEAAERAAHVELQQLEAGVVDVHVGPGLPRHLTAPAAQDGRDLDVVHPDRPGEGGEVTAEQPVREIDQRAAHRLHVGVQLLLLLVPEEQRPGEIAALVVRVQPVVPRQSPDQFRGRDAAALQLVQVQRRQLVMISQHQRSEASRPPA
jgi:hypothetical protein